MAMKRKVDDVVNVNIKVCLCYSLNHLAFLWQNAQEDKKICMMLNTSKLPLCLVVIDMIKPSQNGWKIRHSLEWAL